MYTAKDDSETQSHCQFADDVAGFPALKRGALSRNEKDRLLLPMYIAVYSWSKMGVGLLRDCGLAV